MKTLILIITAKIVHTDNILSYYIGAIIALSLFVYLIYALIKPEKF